MRQSRSEARRPPDKSHALVVGKAPAYMTMRAALLLSFLVSIALMGSSCHQSYANRLHPVLDLVASSNPALHFPNGVRCTWVAGMRGERAQCKFPNGKVRVFPDPWYPGPDNTIRPRILLVTCAT